MLLKFLPTRRLRDPGPELPPRIPPRDEIVAVLEENANTWMEILCLLAPPAVPSRRQGCEPPKLPYRKQLAPSAAPFFLLRPHYLGGARVWLQGRRFR